MLDLKDQITRSVILTGQGLLGLDSPRICVEVKSHDATVGRKMLDV